MGIRTPKGYRKMGKTKTGIIAGNFDVLHPGYIKLFRECKENCDRFIVLLHGDPSIERPSKLKPILSIEERVEMLQSLRFVDDVLTYNLESELYELIQMLEPDILLALRQRLSRLNLILNLKF